MRDLADLVAAGEPLRSPQPHLPAPPLPAGGVSPRCAYRVPRSYARSQPTSRPELYEFNLVNPEPVIRLGQDHACARLAWNLYRKTG
jgi:hypothetical protein